MPGSPRPALVKGAELTPGLGASWGVVDGVMTLAGNPLVGAEEG
jgi:hypothetical protein